MQNKAQNTMNTIPLISDDEIYVITIHLDLEDEQIQFFLSFLSNQEKERAYRFKFKKHRKRYIASRGYLRKILAGQINVNPEKIVFIYSKHGKPELHRDRNIKNICFNLSHSHELAVIALCLNRPVGIDIEYLSGKKDVSGLSERFFSTDEHAKISSLPENIQNEAFYRAWTRKEAYLKATGQGITGIEDIEVSVLDNEPPEILRAPDKSADWSLYDLNTPDNYIASLAVNTKNHKILSFCV